MNESMNICNDKYSVYKYVLTNIQIHEMIEFIRKW